MLLSTILLLVLIIFLFIDVSLLIAELGLLHNKCFSIFINSMKSEVCQVLEVLNKGI